MVILRSCLALPELTELKFIDVEMCWDNDKTTVMCELEDVKYEASMARASHFPNAKKIEYLQLPSNCAGLWNPLPLLLLKSDCWTLKPAKYLGFDRMRTPEIEQVVRKHCPNLTHLTCPDFYVEDLIAGHQDSQAQDGQVARAFIRGCSGLQCFLASNFIDGPTMSRC